MILKPLLKGIHENSLAHFEVVGLIAEGNLPDLSRRVIHRMPTNWPTGRARFRRGWAFLVPNPVGIHKVDVLIAHQWQHVIGGLVIGCVSSLNDREGILNDDAGFIGEGKPEVGYKRGRGAPAGRLRSGGVVVPPLDLLFDAAQSMVPYQVVHEFWKQQPDDLP